MAAHRLPGPQPKDARARVAALTPGRTESQVSHFQPWPPRPMPLGNEFDARRVGAFD